MRCAGESRGFAVETGRPVDEVLNLLFKVHVQWQGSQEAIATLVEDLRS